MITAGIIGHGLVNYLTRLARERYLFDGGEPPGIWAGSAQACSHWNLSGKVHRKILRNLTLGFGPDGHKLVKNAGKLDGKRKRHMGVSYIFNAPKSWSVYWAFADPETRAKMERAFRRAIIRTIQDYIEKEVAHCRLADGTKVAAKVLAAIFFHATSRENDMHYHAHVLFPYHTSRLKLVLG